jgi:DNA-binding response OmpR family regulator
MHIVLIDDEAPIVQALAIHLRSARHTSTIIGEIDDRASLIAELGASGADAVILDFGMDPEGDEVYGWIRGWRKDMPIVFYTCYANTAELRKRMRDAGATDREIIRKTSVLNDLPELLMVLQ